jgi:imidazolonepropionase-like amidohydrolase
MLRFPALLVMLLVESIHAQTYSVMVAGRVAGHETHADRAGSVEVSYSYNDRGRGPEIHGSYRFDSAGLPIAIDLSGVDYNKAPVDEHFSLDNGLSRWKNTAEHGESRTRGWYTTAAGIPAEEAWLARAMLLAGHKSLTLLPAGHVTLERGTTLDIGGRRVTLYQVGGLGFTPEAVWLDADHQLFAAGGVIREGSESAYPKLETAERDAAEARARDLAVRLAHRPASGLVIRHVRVFDAETASIREDQTVAIAGNKIQDSAPPGAEIIDGTGKTLLPGLFDMHAHFDSYQGILNIAGGVTTVRDLGNDMDALLRMKRSMDANQTIGPRVVLAGIIDGRGPYAAPTDKLADTEAEARALIDSYASAGYIQIKIYSSAKPELAQAIVRMAKAKGMRVSGHVPAGMTADQFVDAGADELQHINFLFLNFFPGEAPRTNTRVRLTFPAEHAAGLDLNSPAVTAFVEKLRAKKIVVDPTLTIFENSYLARPGIVSPGLAAIADRLPAEVRRAALQGGLPAPGDQDAVHRASFQAFLNLTARLYRAGVPLVIGTDSSDGFMLHRELELWVQAGIPAEKVLQIATLGAARVARVEAERGSITPGKLADLVLVDGDPVRRISDIRRPVLVIKDGLVYRSADLYRSLQ